MNKGTPADPLREAIEALKWWHEHPSPEDITQVQRKRAARLCRELAALATKPAETPTITERELAFALNYHSDDSRIDDADWKIARRYFEVIERNRGTHPSLQDHPTESAGKTVQRPTLGDREFAALLTKLPALDMTWPAEVRDGWIRCYNTMSTLAETQRSSNANGSDEQTSPSVQPPALTDVSGSYGYPASARSQGLAGVQPPAPEPPHEPSFMPLSLWLATATKEEKRQFSDEIFGAPPSIAQRGAPEPPYSDEPEQDEVLRKFERAGFRYDGQSLWKASLYTEELLALGRVLAQRGAALTDEPTKKTLKAMMSAYWPGRFGATHDCWGRLELEQMRAVYEVVARALSPERPE